MVKNIYNLKYIQKEAEKKKSAQKEADEILLQEAEDIERQNFLKTQNMNQLLETSLAKQKQTTETMKKQGEKIKKAEKTAVSTYTGAKKAVGLADELNKNSSFISANLPSFMKNIKCFFGKTEEDNDVEKIKNAGKKKSGGYKDEEEEYEDNGFIKQRNGHEYVKGADKTNQELEKVLNNLQKIEREAKVQSTEADQQTSNLKNINRINEYAKKKMDEANSNLNNP